MQLLCPGTSAITFCTVNQLRDLLIGKLSEPTLCVQREKFLFRYLFCSPSLHSIITVHELQMNNGLSVTSVHAWTGGGAYTIHLQ